jgi:hypothetical protein
MIDLQEYGVTKKWVIITEMSKEIENNTIARVNAYARQYVPRRNVAAGGSNMEVVLYIFGLIQDEPVI